MSVLEKIVYWGAKIQLYLGVAALFAIIVSMTGGIIMRFIGHPFAWTEELCTVLFVWLSFMGASVAAWQRRHICVDNIVGKLNPAMAKTMKIIILALILVFLVVLFAGAVKFLPRTVHATTVALGIPRYASYVPIAICSFYMFFAYLYDLLTVIRLPVTASTASQACS